MAEPPTSAERARKERVEVTPPEATAPEVTVGPIAHGGHCIARHEGRVIFVRHALPGERVRLRITDTSQDRFWRADAIEVLEAAPDRVRPDCPVSGPGGCGGCDFQHVSDSGELELKRSVVAEQLARLAGIDWTGAVEAVPPVRNWRHRMRYLADAGGEPALRAHRSHELIRIPDDGCPIASVDPRALGVPEVAEQTSLTVVDAAEEQLLLVGDADESVVEEAAGRRFEVQGQGFWQVHPAAVDTLVTAVLEGLRPAAGERAFDLYCGVGVFAGALADAGVTVWGVESDKPAISHARRNVREAKFSSGRVDRVLPKLPRRTDLVVLDPPRAGAGRKVLEQVTAREPRAIAYVACDPAALARDLAYAAELGYTPDSIRAFNLFPRTHHIEAVAILTPN
ncbi:tRNA/tmRNA/rRNA uracil-C5-methylase [Enemella evansiae]|uniref:tRNA/tmRNA/rRNA uracil-C5-methylase n=1 Tax=Enemella evansiae TaxID=2016499 RepID=A0A255G3I2_9ACTN|nr:TRAM domain-containing protein [Enemella evansiae]OYO10470.1 tRNA/tmRNA/rRNA uracil-C5-methylase [Enemella evansiae]